MEKKKIGGFFENNLGEGNNVEGNNVEGNFGEGNFGEGNNGSLNIGEENQFMNVNINNLQRNKNRLNSLDFDELIQEIHQKITENQINDSNIEVYWNSLLKFIKIKTFLKPTTNLNSLSSEIIMVKLILTNNNSNNNNERHEFEIVSEWGPLKNYRDQLNVLLDELGENILQNKSISEEEVIQKIWKKIKKNNEKYLLQKNYILQEIIQSIYELASNSNFNKNSSNAFQINKLQQILYQLNENESSKNNKNLMLSLFDILDELNKSRSSKIKNIVENTKIYINSFDLKKSDMIFGFLFKCTILKILDVKFKKTLFIDIPQYKKILFENLMALFQLNQFNQLNNEPNENY